MLSALPLVLATAAAADAPPLEGEERWEAGTVLLVVEHGHGAPAKLQEAVEEAAATWNAVGVGPRLEVARDDEPVADPLVVDEHSRIGMMHEPWPYADNVGGATIAWSSTSTSVIFEADLALNPEVDFGDGEAERHDLVSILTHELGHVLGLHHLEDDREATMFPSIPRGETKKRDLSVNDVAALIARYADTPLAAEDPDALLEVVAREEDREEPRTGCAQGGLPALEGALALALMTRRRRHRCGR